MKEFKKDDYIVALEVDFVKLGRPTYKTVCIADFYCIKQRVNDHSICPEIDLQDSPSHSNRNSDLKFDKSMALVDWRYATQDEIDYYELHGKPFDTRELINSVEDIISKLNNLEQKYENK